MIGAIGGQKLKRNEDTIKKEMGCTIVTLKSYFQKFCGNYLSVAIVLVPQVLNLNCCQ